MALKPMKAVFPTNSHNFLFLKMKACLVNFSEIQTLTGASWGKVVKQSEISNAIIFAQREFCAISASRSAEFGGLVFTVNIFRAMYRAIPWILIFVIFFFFSFSLMATNTISN